MYSAVHSGLVVEFVETWDVAAVCCVRYSSVALVLHRVAL
jgi:hypothetical protein